jgi:hypothetical protein
MNRRRLLVRVAATAAALAALTLPGGAADLDRGTARPDQGTTLASPPVDLCANCT